MKAEMADEMRDSIGIVGIGYEGFRPIVADLSTREMMFEAASKAYAEAGVDPRRDVGSFVCCTEDLWEGWSITDEMVPDQIGGAQRPLCTIAADGIAALGNAVMQIRAGIADVVALEAHSKVADVLDKDAVERLALDPNYLRPLGLPRDALAELEMSAFLSGTGFAREDCDRVVFAAKKNAMKNPRASYGAILDKSFQRNFQLFDKAQFAEAAIVIVLASAAWIRRKRKEAIFIEGVSWNSSLPWYEGGAIERSEYASRAFEAASKQAGVSRSVTDYDVVEVDDTYSYKLLQHLNSLFPSTKEARAFLDKRGVPLNPSGGSLGVGNLIEASPLHKILECFLQLKGQAGPLQIAGARNALVVSWRGIPTASGGVAIMSR
jgi:acetyl-CoA C-acetyltransferase